jgi:hypothetical protein
MKFRCSGLAYFPVYAALIFSKHVLNTCPLYCVQLETTQSQGETIENLVISIKEYEP